MPDALWIDEDYLMANSIIYENTDMKVITPNIIHVQHTYIKDLLGDRLFAVIQAEINAQVYTTRVSNLLENLKLCVMNYVIAESASDMVYKWMNKGIVVKTGENSQTISPGQLEHVQKKYINRAQTFGQRVTNYILRYETTYPEYNQNTEINEIQPKSISAKTGIYLDDDSENCLDNKSKRRGWYS
jgi:hypothetical protein